MSVCAVRVRARSSEVVCVGQQKFGRSSDASAASVLFEASEDRVSSRAAEPRHCRARYPGTDAPSARCNAHSRTRTGRHQLAPQFPRVSE